MYSFCTSHYCLTCGQRESSRQSRRSKVSLNVRIILSHLELEPFQNKGIESFLMQHMGKLIDRILQIALFDDRLWHDITEQTDLLAHFWRNGPFGSAD